MLKRTVVAALLALTMLPSADWTASAASPSGPYADWPNGPWQNAAFFPISVWYQNANTTGHSGKYANLAQAAAATRINIFLGQGVPWPESYGSDQGELEAIKSAGVYVIGGIATPSTENTSAGSVASMLSLAGRIGATANLIGYNAGDEPQCDPGSGQTAMSAVPSIVSGIAKYDKTRLVTFNQTDWMVQPQWQHQPCLTQEQNALKATSVGSFDVYPLTSPYVATNLGATGSDFRTVPNDTLWEQGLSVQALQHFAATNQPLWAYIESGGDNFALSQANDSLPASVQAGSRTLVNASGRSQFTSTWLGLAVSGTGIPSGATITAIVDPTHATMSAAATATVSGSVAIGSGTMADCVAGANLCVVNGNEYRPTAAQVNAEVWMSIIAGAIGIEYFCDDSTSYSFCLGDSAGGGAAATAAQQNLQATDIAVATYAPVLNAPTIGVCSMQQFDYSTGTASSTTSCSGGSLTMSTSNAALPGMALMKSYNNATYLLAQADRRLAGGASFTFALAKLGGHTATVAYDSYAHYDSGHSTEGQTFTLDGSGRFSDVLGAGGHDYGMKIYQIN